MRILTRFVMVLALLGALAYGSYGLGKYVLSHKLFGNSITPVEGSVLDGSKTASKKAVTQQVPLKGKPHVEVDVLPADEADPGPEISDFSALQKTARDRSGSSEKQSASQNSSPTARSESKTRTFSTNDPVPRFRSGYDSSGDGNSYSEDEDRPRRRRRRYSDDDSRSSERRTTRKKRRRVRRSEESPVPRAETSRTQSRSEPRSESRSSSPSRSESNSSPVPKPESSSGGSSSLGGAESPVPQPE